MTHPGSDACEEAADRACENLLLGRGVTERVSGASQRIYLEEDFGAEANHSLL